MFEALKALLRPAVETDPRQQLEAAVAALLFEMTRMDGVQSGDDLAAIQSDALLRGTNQSSTAERRGPAC